MSDRPKLRRLREWPALLLAVSSVLGVFLLNAGDGLVASTLHRSTSALRESTALLPGHPPQEIGPDRMRLILEHDNTAFPLIGRHRFVDCGSCHQDGVLGGTPQACQTCHWARSRDDVYNLQLGTECGDCHSPQGWKPLIPGSWDHQAMTGFRLEGTHRILDCTQCHNPISFRQTTAECSQCHMEDFQRAQNPNHVTANFPMDCQLCHFSEAQWQGASFDHNFFPLTGQHQAVACESCHQDGQFAGTPSQCIDCHRPEFEQTTNPSHLEGNFSTDCTVCHGATAASWAGATFDHDSTFPLVGNHKAAACEQCHINGRIAGTPTDCVGCHLEEFQSTQSPNHQAAGFSTNCASCHGASATTWATGGFDHNEFFTLRGSHAVADCQSCHVNGQYAGTSSQCVSCHRSEYNATTSPAHAQAGFSTNCDACHGNAATSWLGANFDHDRVFALRGQHQAAQCETCHVNGRYAGTSSECVSCHRDEYTRTSAPNHMQSGFGVECELCHGSNANSWFGAAFDHNQFFRLVGRHQAVQCASCHVNGRFAGTPTDCVSCHRDDYSQTTNPNHPQSGFGTDCVQCHGDTANSWQGATFDHNQYFRLNGRHQTAVCASCHVNGRFAGTPSDCIGCHRPEYDATQTPNHQSAGFGTNCQSCHGDSATTWLGAVFNHNQFFQLNGKHQAADCALCHVNGRYAGTPSNCVDCHRPEYDATQNPNHQTVGFGTDCASCHGNAANTWQGANFDHNTVFPLQGPHRTLDCQLCHANQPNPPRNCFGCHAADYNATRNPDHVRSGFGTSCEGCHLTTHVRWDQAQFNHTFPIDNGPHKKFDCAECHKSANAREFVCTDCHKHTKPRMDDKHKEVGGYVWTSQACYACHPDGKS